MSVKRLPRNDPADKNAHALRDLQARFADNKKCFECSQRGPTYVDTTIGSFVCSKCSGVLRGITPPHRIKSISMSSFSTDEIEYIKARGNSYNSKVWLGLYDKARATTDLKDEDSIKELIIQKYEKKRFYVDPSQITHTEEPEEIPRTSSFSLSPPSKFSSGLIGSTLLHKSQTGPTASPPVLISKPLSTPPNSQAHSSVIIPAENQKQEIIKWPAAIPKPTTVQAVDPFASFVNVTENPTTKIPNSAVSSGDMNFANFDAVNFYTSPAIDPLNASTNSNTSSAINFSFSPLTPASMSSAQEPTTSNQKKNPSQKPIMTSSLSEDRYAALKDLDNIFKTSVELNAKTSSTPEPLPVAGLTNNGFGKNHNPFASDFNTNSQLNTSPWPMSVSPGGPGFTSPSFGQNGAFGSSGGSNSNGPSAGSSNGAASTASNYFPSPWDSPATINSGSSNPNDFFSSKPFSNPWSEASDSGSQPFASQFGFNKKNPFL